MRKETDPWNLLGNKRKSTCCKEKEQEIISYDHTGAIIWRCECGHETGWEYD